MSTFFWKKIGSKDFLGGLGLGFLFVAPLIAWSVFRFFGINSPTDLFATLSLGIILIFYGVERFKFRLQRNLYYYIGFLLLLLFLVGLVIKVDFKNFGWVLFGLVLFIVLPGRFKGDVNLLTTGFLVSIFFGVTGYLLINYEQIIFLNSIQSQQRISFENEAYTLTAYAAATGIVLAFFYISRNGINFLSISTLGLSAYIVILSGTRSVYGGIFISIVYILIGSKVNQSVHLSKYKRNFYIFISIILMMIIIGLLSDRFEILVSRIVEGLYSLFSANSYLDQSAVGRRIQRAHALNLFSQHPLSGAGIKYYWVDFPLLQIFSDMGLFIGSVYILYFFLYPLNQCRIGFWQKNQTQMLLGSLYLLNLPRMFLHGQPYDWGIFIYTLPLLAFNPRITRDWNLHE
ncbi:MAG: hypothetical protein KA740_09375 [Rhodoferax sp.]|nr:hypothetical protein [Rhodoferax sp.]